jgi:hypothetical protein
MPPYLSLAMLMSCIWIILFIYQRQMRARMLAMSIVVIPFAFFDYFSQPAYWQPETMLDIPVGIEGVLFGFSFGGVAAVIFNAKDAKHSGYYKTSFSFRNMLSLLPVMLISIGIWAMFGVNMMITLPVGLLAGWVIIIYFRHDLARRLLLSSLYFGILYSLVLSFWLVLFPAAQQWWNLSVYGGIAVNEVPLGEVLFGFLFGGFWNAGYEFVVISRRMPLHVSLPNQDHNAVWHSQP